MTRGRHRRGMVGGAALLALLALALPSTSGAAQQELPALAPGRGRPHSRPRAGTALAGRVRARASARGLPPRARPQPLRTRPASRSPRGDGDPARPRRPRPRPLAVPARAREPHPRAPDPERRRDPSLQGGREALLRRPGLLLVGADDPRRAQPPRPNRNGLPDYVETTRQVFKTVWDAQVGRLRYRAPTVRRDLAPSRPERQARRLHRRRRRRGALRLLHDRRPGAKPPARGLGLLRRRRRLRAQPVRRRGDRPGGAQGHRRARVLPRRPVRLRLARGSLADGGHRDLDRGRGLRLRERQPPVPEDEPDRARELRLPARLLQPGPERARLGLQVRGLDLVALPLGALRAGRRPRRLAPRRRESRRARRVLAAGERVGAHAPGPGLRDRLHRLRRRERDPGGHLFRRSGLSRARARDDARHPGGHRANARLHAPPVERLLPLRAGRARPQPRRSPSRSTCPTPPGRPRRTRSWRRPTGRWPGYRPCWTRPPAATGSSSRPSARPAASRSSSRTRARACAAGRATSTRAAGARSTTTPRSPSRPPSRRRRPSGERARPSRRRRRPARRAAPPACARGRSRGRRGSAR